MKIYSVYDDEFRAYGQILSGYDIKPLLEEMKKIPLPDAGTSYLASVDSFESCNIYEQLTNRAYGGMPIELGMCWGRNTKLNCLEYHRDSEFNLGTDDFILLLAKRDEIVNGSLDTACVTAFQIPAEVLIEVYATTLHFAPCHMNEENGFRVAVILPRGTNLDKPTIIPQNAEDQMLWASNKWLLAHKDSKQAGLGAYIGLEGENIDIKDSI